MYLRATRRDATAVVCGRFRVISVRLIGAEPRVVLGSASVSMETGLAQIPCCSRGLRGASGALTGLLSRWLEITESSWWMTSLPLVPADGSWRDHAR